MGYWPNVLNAIADIMDSGIFVIEIEKTATRKTMVYNPAGIAKEITMVET